MLGTTDNWKIVSNSLIFSKNNDFTTRIIKIKKNLLEIFMVLDNFLIANDYDNENLKSSILPIKIPFSSKIILNIIDSRFVFVLDLKKLEVDLLDCQKFSQFNKYNIKRSSEHLVTALFDSYLNSDNELIVLKNDNLKKNNK